LPADNVRSVGSGSLFSRGAAAVYLIAALAAFGLAAYMAFAEQRPLLSIAVIAPAVGGLWFLLRLFMVARALKD
jgi:hypothetical protein